MLSRAQELLESAVVCPLPVPALNKWTKLGPTIARVTFMSHFCGLLGHCLRKEFGKLAEREGEEQQDADEEPEAARAETRACRWTKEQLGSGWPTSGG